MHDACYLSKHSGRCVLDHERFSFLPRWAGRTCSRGTTLFPPGPDGLQYNIEALNPTLPIRSIEYMDSSRLTAVDALSQELVCHCFRGGWVGPILVTKQLSLSVLSCSGAQMLP